MSDCPSYYNHAPQAWHALLILDHGPIWQYASTDFLKLATKQFYTKFGFQQSRMTLAFFFFLCTDILQNIFRYTLIKWNFEPVIAQTLKTSLFLVVCAISKLKLSTTVTHPQWITMALNIFLFKTCNTWRFRSWYKWYKSESWYREKQFYSNKMQHKKHSLTTLRVI